MSIIKERPLRRNNNNVPRSRTRRASFQAPSRLVFAQPELAPDTEDHVEQETESIFRSFMYARYQDDMTDLEAIEQTPPLPELTSFTQEPTSDTARVGRQLAMIGDDINERYRAQFDELVAMLNVTPDTAYEAFAGVARRLLSGAPQMHWGRVITLMCFGYRIAMNVLTRGFRGFFNKIIQFMVKFFVTERIAKWIADQGGWRAALNYMPEKTSWRYFACVVGTAFVSVAAVWWLTGRRS